MTNHTQLFLSWTQKVRKFPVVQRLVNDLRNIPNLKLWLDAEQLSAGDNFVDVIGAAIQHADYFIQIIDNDSNLPSWSNIEFQVAYSEQLKQQNLKIIKIVVSEKSNISSGMLGSGFSGVVIGLSNNNYGNSYNAILEVLNIGNTDKLIDFHVDKIISQRTIIDISSQINDRLIKHFSQNPNELKVINRRLFEELIAELFHGFGFEVELTKQTRDGGRDIVAIKNAEVGLKYLIECKRPDPGNVIGIRPVRELYGVKQDEKASKAILATTTYFSPDALQFFDRNKWELEPKDFNGVMNWISEYLKINNIA
ncbi:MAG: restriction endonuclease [Bacteroidales bacterium]|nr:restriction endonuclease [Bacteroidales bacterium]